MDLPNAQVTDTAYEPDADLRDSLVSLEDVAVSYQADQELDLPGELTAKQREYTMSYGTDDGDELTLSGTETMGAPGMFVSLEGSLGFAAGIILQHALILGEPTQCYTDEGIPRDASMSRYQDLTAEWYRPAAVEQGLPQARLEHRTVDFEATELPLKETERYARQWLSLHE